MITNTTSRALVGLFMTACVSLLSCGCKDDAKGAPRCDHFNEERNLYFGDLHSHTALSFDAWGYQVRTSPADAYRFARGEEVELGTSGTVKIDRPLDFAAVTDHAELLAEVHMCTVPGSAAYDEQVCVSFREGGEDNVKSFGVKLAAYSPERFEQICGVDGLECMPVIETLWQEIVGAANEAQDDTAACTFTGFPGYEYTATPGVTNLHRNVLFAGDALPQAPISYFEESSRPGLWRALDEQCVQVDGCDAMSIPHNSNWSNGKMFTPSYEIDPELSLEERKALTELRARMEPTVEIHQHKGDMECKAGFDGVWDEDDPFCDFEKIREADFADCGEGTGIGGATHTGCLSKLDYIRNVFKQGLVEQRTYEVNPYHMAVIGSTDTHNGTPGNVTEKGFIGHVGTTDDTPERRLGDGTVTHHPSVYNPGGLAAIWAKENTREAIFEALRAGETYSTSGPRIEVRFFGGWELDGGMCQGNFQVEEGYEKGVPMGGDLTAKDGEAPSFAVFARWDEGSDVYPGTRLERIQIVKGWITGDGIVKEKVFHVAGDDSEPTDDGVDTSSCERTGEGEETLCAVWKDPEFSANQAAFYYARVLERPSCRWSAFDCNQLDQDAGPDSGPSQACSPTGLPKAIRERAITSPIWYTP